MRVFLLALAFATAAFSVDPLTIGQKLDAITVSAPDGKAVSFDLSGSVTAVIFVGTKCPISNDYNERMSAVYREYSAKGVKFIFVNSNINEPASEVAEHSKASGLPFQVHKDPGNVLADRFGATVTPETYVFDAGGVLRYHGHIDDSRNPARIRVHTLRTALDEILDHKEVTRSETKAFGCTIKRVKKVS